MKPPAAKEKTKQLGRARLALRVSGPTTSYPKTRVRVSRLLNAARILAFIELTHRLHQAYEQAYDQQAADRLLPQDPTPTPQQQSCDPVFFDENRNYTIAGDANNRNFTGADLNFAARVVFAESSSSTSGLGDQVNLERDAIASVLYNRIGVAGFPDRTARTTFQAVSEAPNAFEAVTGRPFYTQKFRSSDIASGAYRNLQEARVNSRGQIYGGACNDLRGSVDAIRRLTRYGSDYGYTQFRAGTTGQGTVIGGSRFW